MIFKNKLFSAFLLVAVSAHGQADYNRTQTEEEQPFEPPVVSYHSQVTGVPLKALAELSDVVYEERASPKDARYNEKMFQEKIAGNPHLGGYEVVDTVSTAEGYKPSPWQSPILRAA